MSTSEDPPSASANEEASSRVVKPEPSTSISMVFLDRALRVTHYTPQAAELFNLTPETLDHSFTDIPHQLHYPGLAVPGKFWSGGQAANARSEMLMEGGFWPNGSFLTSWRGRRVESF